MAFLREMDGGQNKTDRNKCWSSGLGTDRASSLSCSAHLTIGLQSSTVKSSVKETLTGVHFFKICLFYPLPIFLLNC